MRIACQSAVYILSRDMIVPTLLAKALSKLKLLRFFNLEARLDLGSRAFIVPLRGQLGYATLRMSDLYMQTVLAQALKLQPKGSFVDVGANSGQTLLKLRALDWQRPYLGFEPNPHSAAYTSRLIEINQLPAARLLPCGLSAQVTLAELKFYKEEDGDLNASVIDGLRPNNTIYRTLPVVLMDLPALVNARELQEVGILKIDVEGGELEVLQGFEPLIAKQLPLIVLEILPAYSAEYTDRIERQNAIWAMLGQYNYAWFRIHELDGYAVRYERIHGIEIHADYRLSNYLIVSAQQARMLEELG